MPVTTAKLQLTTLVIFLALHVCLVVSQIETCVDLFTQCHTDVFQACCCYSDICTCCLVTEQCDNAIAPICVAPPVTPSPAPSQSPSLSPSLSPSASNVVASVSASSTASPSFGASSSPTASHSVTPSATPSPSLSLVPSISPSASLAPSLSCGSGGSTAAAVSFGQPIGCTSDGVVIVQVSESAPPIQRTVPVVRPLIINGSVVVGNASSINFYAANSTLTVIGNLTLSGCRVALRIDAPPSPLNDTWLLFNVSEGELYAGFGYQTNNASLSEIDVVQNFDYHDVCSKLVATRQITRHSLAIVMSTEREDTPSCNGDKSGSASSNASTKKWWLAVLVVPIACAALCMCVIVGVGVYAKRNSKLLWILFHYEQAEDRELRKQSRKRQQTVEQQQHATQP